MIYFIGILFVFLVVFFFLTWGIEPGAYDPEEYVKEWKEKHQ